MWSSGRFIHLSLQVQLPLQSFDPLEPLASTRIHDGQNGEPFSHHTHSGTHLRASRKSRAVHNNLILLPLQIGRSARYACSKGLWAHMWGPGPSIAVRLDSGRLPTHFNHLSSLYPNPWTLTRRRGFAGSGSSLRRNNQMYRRSALPPRLLSLPQISATNASWGTASPACWAR